VYTAKCLQPSSARGLQPQHLRRQSVLSATPTIEEQIHALPRNLFDSDSEDASDCNGPCSGPSSPNMSPPTTPQSETAPSKQSFGYGGWTDCMQSTVSAMSFSPLSVLSARSGQRPFGESARADTSGEFSVDAVPFVPRSSLANTHSASFNEVRTSQELSNAIMASTTCERLSVLLTDHAKLLDASCFAAAMQRLLLLHANGRSGAANIHEVAQQIASCATGASCAHPSAATVFATVLQGMVVLGEPLSVPPIFTLVTLSVQQLRRSRSLWLLCACSAALRQLSSDMDDSVLSHMRAEVGHAVSHFLLQTPYSEMPCKAIQDLAFGLQLSHMHTPEMFSVLGHAACQHVGSLSCSTIITVLQLLVSSHSTDAATLGVLARAFHDQFQVCFVGLCKLCCVPNAASASLHDHQSHNCNEASLLVLFY
jgi:hypothetical protein